MQISDEVADFSNLSAKCDKTLKNVWVIVDGKKVGCITAPLLYLL